MAENITVSTLDIEQTPLYKNVKAELDTVKAKLDEVTKKTLAEKDEDMKKMEKDCADLKAKLASAEKDFEDFKKKKADAEKEAETKMSDAAAKATAELDKVVAELDAEKKTRQAYEDATRKAKRGAAILSADATMAKAKVDELVKQFANLSDQTFAAFVETIKGYAEKAPKEVAKSTAEDVVNKSVTAVVTNPEDALALGVTDQNQFSKAVSDIRDWYGKKNAKAGSK